jgi:tetratricopeptide (TPR) repeat protein
MSRVQMEPKEPQLDVTEKEINAAEKLRGYGELSTALAMTQDMLRRVQDGDKRMRLLFDVLRCSTQLRADSVTDDAIRELEKYPYPEFSRVLANSIRAYAEISLGRPQDALALLDMNIETGFFEREDFRAHKYDLCLYKGMALERLSRWNEALEWLEKAHAMYPDEASAPDQYMRRHFGWAEVEILFNKARCMYGLNRYDEALNLSKRAYDLATGGTKTVAMMYIANTLAMQGKYSEALRFYIQIQGMPPSKSVPADQLQEGIRRCMDYLEKLNPLSKTF